MLVVWCSMEMIYRKPCSPLPDSLSLLRWPNRTEPKQLHAKISRKGIFFLVLFCLYIYRLRNTGGMRASAAGKPQAYGGFWSLTAQKEGGGFTSPGRMDGLLESSRSWGEFDVENIVGGPPRPGTPSWGSRQFFLAHPHHWISPQSRVRRSHHIHSFLPGFPSAFLSAFVFSGSKSGPVDCVSQLLLFERWEAFFVCFAPG